MGEANRTNRCASSGAAFIASLALIGWFADLPLLASGLPGEATMKIPTAAAFLLAALAMAWMPARSAPARLVVWGCAGLVVVLGFASLLTLLGSLESVLQAAVAPTAATGDGAGQAMAPNTALALACLGASILLLADANRSVRLLAGAITAFIAAWFGLYEAIGYLSGVLSGNGWSSPTSMSLPTALLLCLLGGSCLFTAWRANGATWPVRPGLNASFLVGLLVLAGLAIHFFDRLLDSTRLPIATFAGVTALSVLFLLFKAEADQRRRVERTLRAREEQGRTDAATQAIILDAIPAQLALLAADGTVTVVNAAWRRFAVDNGLAAPDFAVGTNYLAIAEGASGEHGEEGRRAADGIRQVLRGEAAEFSLEYPCDAPDEQRWLRLLATPAVVDGSRGAVVMHLNITGQRLGEDALRESEERFRATFEGAPIGIANIALDGHFLRVNDRLCQILGYTHEDLVTKTFADVTAPQDLDTSRQARAALLEQATSGYATDKRYLRSDGSEVWVSVRSTLLQTPSGEPLYFVSTFADITERRAALARLERLNRLQTLLGRIGEAVLRSKGPEEVFASVCDTLADEEQLQAAFIVEVREIHAGSHEARVTYAAGKAADVLPRQAVAFEDLANGLGTIGAALQTGTHDVCNDVEAALRADLFKELARRGRFRSSASFAFRRGDGTSGALVVCAREPDHFRGDEIRLMEAVARYLTLAVELHEQQQTRARAEAALQASEQRFRLLAEATNDAIWEFDVAADRLEWSEGFERLFGHRRDQIEPGLASWLNRIHPEDRARVTASFQAALDGPESTWKDDYRFTCADGSEAHVADRGHIIRSDEGLAMTVFGGMTDHTERRRAQQTMRQQAAMLDHVGQSVVTTDLAGTVIYANRATETLFGWTREEMIGRPVVDLLVPRSTRQQAEEIMQALVNGRSWSGEFDVQSRTGRVFTAHVTDSPVLDEQGRVVGVIGISADITERKLAEQVLRDSEHELRALTGQLSAERERLLDAQTVAKLGSWETDLATMNVSWSPENYRIYELSSDHSPTYYSSRELVHLDDWTRIDQAFRESLVSPLPGPFVAEHRLVFPDGRIKHVEERWRVVRNEAGQPVRVSGTCLDVTERHAAQLALQESERQFEVLANSMPQFVWVTDALGRSLYVNDRWYAYTAMSPKHLNDAAARVFHHDDIRRAAETWQRALETGEPCMVEARMRGVDSEYRWFLIRGEPQKDEAGRVLKWFGTCTDIQDLKQAEVDISRSNRALQMLSRCNDALIRAEDETTLLTEVCRIAVESGGYRLAWVGDVRPGDSGAIGVEARYGRVMSLDRLGYADGDAQGAVDMGPIREAAASRQPVIVARRDAAEVDGTPGAGGAEAREGMCCVPLRSSTDLLGILVLHGGEPQRAPEDELRLLQELANNIGFGLANLRSRLARLRLQQAVEKVASAVSTISGDAFFVELVRHMANVLEAPAAFVARLLPGDTPRARTLAGCVDGRLCPTFEFRLEDYPGFNGGKEAAIERGMAEHHPVIGKLSGIEAQALVGARLYNAAGEQVGLLFVLYRAALHDTAFITSTLRIFAARAASEIERQQSHAQLLEQATLLDAAHEAIYLESLDGELRYWSKGAQRLLGWKSEEVVGRDLPEVFTDEAKLAQARRQVRLDGVWEGEFEARSKHGQLLILESSWTLIKDEAGRPQSILVISTDVTERKQIEKQFFRAQRMESIGTLAGGIAHDLNNALAPVITGLDLLQMKFPDEETRELLELIGAGAQRGVEMVRQVLSFARGVEGARIEVPVRPILQEMEKIIRDSFPKNIQLRTSGGADLWTVQGDPTQIHQVLMNLCVNARDAMPDGGVLTLTAANRELDAHDAGLMLDAAPGPYVMLEVSDTGTGMPPETIERIFEPFFTTKDVGQGTGLGLSTTLAIMKSHGGLIQVSSEVGRGTTFTVYLPARTLAPADRTADKAAELPRGQGQLVLVVDDEASVRQVTRRMLEAFGYRVVMASDGADALAIHADRQGEIEVVLTDMMMPQMDGPSMIRELRRVDPTLPVIAASGLSASAQLTQAASLGVEHFLPKPYGAEALLRTLQAVCNRPLP